MRYNSTLCVSLQIPTPAKVTFNPVAEVMLACHKCLPADRTIILGESAPAQHFGPPASYDGHPFDGRVVSFASEAISTRSDSDSVIAKYFLSYDFQPFLDAKYPERPVTPQPTWGRIHFTIRCACGRNKETYTQTNLVRPRKVVCECGQILLVENEQPVSFSKAEPED